MSGVWSALSCRAAGPGRQKRLSLSLSLALASVVRALVPFPGESLDATLGVVPTRDIEKTGHTLAFHRLVRRSRRSDRAGAAHGVASATVNPIWFKVAGIENVTLFIRLIQAIV